MCPASIPSSLRPDWPFGGRGRELLKLEGILAGGRTSGVVLVGTAGVGKTRLAAECLGLAEQRGFAPARATATKTAQSIPFGALATLLPPSTDLPPVDNRAEMIRRLAVALVDQNAPKRIALFIDDAHLLDDATATLVHQLVTSKSAFVLLTVRTSEPLPDAITSLWKDSLAERVAVSGFALDAAAEVLSAALDGPMDTGTLRRLVAHTRGNIMFIKELVLGAVEDGSLRNEDGLWRQVLPLTPSDRLVELVETRLSALTREHRSVLELLAFGEPIGRRELQILTRAEATDQLERKGLLVGELSGRRLQVRLAHPLYADVLRATTPAVRAIEVNRLLAEAAETVGERRREDTLRIATWRLACGGASPSLMLKAARAARWSYDFALAARLVEAAVDAGAGFDARLLAVQVAALRGHSAHVEEDLTKLAGEAKTDAERGAVVLTQLDNLAFSLAKIDEGLCLAEAAENQIRDPIWKDEIRARRASFLLVAPSKGPQAAVEAAEPLLHRATGSGKVWASFTASCSLTRLGRMQDALHWADQGWSEHLKIDKPLEWYPWIHVYSRGEALAQLGRFEEAGALALEQYEKGIEEGSAERQAFFAWQHATRVSEQGGVRSAIQRCREARALYEQLGRPFFVRHCLVHLSLALALAGQAAEAEKTLQGLDAMDLPPQLFAYSGDLFQARAWTAAARGDLPGARQLLQEGLAFGETTGDLIGQATALHGLARLGWARQTVQRLCAVTAKIDGDLWATRATHAKALARSSSDDLHSASAKFESMGALLLAAEASANEASAHKRAGQERKATAAQRRAHALAQDCEGATTPALRGLTDIVAITDAERRAAHLAGAGRTNKEIAEEFHLSVRTVEHQLQSVYAKLGISGRQDLADALAAGEI